MSQRRGFAPAGPILRGLVIGRGTPSGVGMLLARMSREFGSSIRNALVEAT